MSFSSAKLRAVRSALSIANSNAPLSNKSLVASLYSSWVERCNAVQSSLFTGDVSASWLINNFIIFWLPLSTARCNAVLPLWSCADMTAPLFKSKVTTCKDPLSTAKYTDVCPLLSVVDVSAPHIKLLRRVLMSAQHSAVLWYLSCSNTETPCSNSSCKTVRWSWRAACRRGVESIGSLGECWVPCSNRRRHVPTYRVVSRTGKDG